MSFREMDSFLKYLFSYYEVSNFQVQENHQHYGKSIYSLVQKTLTLLNAEEYRMIENEYIFKKWSWWDEYYSRATFYRQKKKIMKKFIAIISKM